jgi:branched-chain amino acid transport system substrate-binding protein
VSGRRLRLGAYLSLTGRYARFGQQAAAGLRVLHRLTDDVDLHIEDDAGEPRRIREGLADLAGRCDLLLGPYSTQLMRAAGQAIEHVDALLWNHGGSGDDVQTSPSKRVISVLTPTSRYAEPYLGRMAGARQVWIVQGPGSFGRQVAEGAEAIARNSGLRVERHEPAEPLPAGHEWSRWDVFTAGTFEDDVATVRRLQGGPGRPRSLCSVAAGVGDFVREVADPEGVYGIAQWFTGEGSSPRLGPSESQFLSAYRDLTHAEPDYPAIQAAASAVIAVHCARTAGSVAPAALRGVVVELNTQTLYGPFRVDGSGRQISHRTVLVQWTGGRLIRS